MIKSADELIKAAQQVVDCVDVETARKLCADNAGAVIIDVREADSVAQSKLNDSVHISRGLLEMKVAKVCEDPNTCILTHCAGGGRATLAAATLREMGYEKVYAITAKYEDIKSAFG